MKNRRLPGVGLHEQFAGERPMKNKFVAVVEDEPAIRQLINVVLEAGGYSVQHFRDGQELLDNFHPWIGVVVVGLMEARANGLKSLRELRRRGLKNPVLTVGGPGSDKEAAAARQLGAREHLSKPFRPEALLAAMGRLGA